MKIRFKVILVVAGVLIANIQYFSHSFAAENPRVESFKFSPTEIELQSAQTTVDIELIVNHPLGIENITSLATIKDRLGNTWGAYLYRSDVPTNKELKRVIFKGSILLPRNISSGVYSVEASEVKNNLLTGYQFGTGKITSTKIRDLIDAENSLLVTNGGDLNYAYSTFQGPTYSTSLSIAYKDPVMFNSTKTPIWKVNEKFDPNVYYEKLVPALNLEIKSLTPLTCPSDGKLLSLVKTGSCEFIVFTSKNSIFAYYENKQVVEITNERSKSELFIPKVEAQTSKNLPKSLSLPQVYSAAVGYVLPTSKTPSICIASGFTVNLLSGGTCTLTYQTAATTSYLASEIYQQTFEILRDSQTIIFTLPSGANVSSKSLALAAIASSGAAVSYSTTSTGICSITGSTLNLLASGNCTVTATQAGTSTLAPIASTAIVMLTGAAVSNRKTITCVKGKSTKKVSGVNPKCPKGFKIKR